MRHALLTATILTLASAANAQVGVNTHLNYAAYADLPTVEKSLDYLGITNVRDNLNGFTANPAPYNALAAKGIKFDLVVPPGNVDISSVIGQLHTFTAQNPGSLAAIEGSNEVNLQPVSFNGQTGIAAAAAWQKALYAAVKSDPVLKNIPVINTSLGGGSQAQYAALGNLSKSADFGNAHIYPKGADPSTYFAANIPWETKLDTPDLPTAVTETGISGQGNLPALVKAAQSYGGPTYLYELLPSGPNATEQGFALFNADGSPKAETTALRTALGGAPTGPTSPTPPIDAGPDVAGPSSPSPNPAPPAVTPSQPQPPSVITPADGMKDCDGRTWSINAEGRIEEDGALVPGGGGTAALTIEGCTVYGKDDGNHGGGWFTMSSNDPGANQFWTHSPPPQVAPPTDTNPPGPVAQSPLPPGQCPAATATGGGFHVANGQITGPNGVYQARGVNLYGNDMGASQDGALITKTFPGTNFIRFIARPLNDPTSYDAFVNGMTGEGRVVEFEDHPDGGGSQGTVYTGARLAAESAWYAAMASHFKNNPYVWFGTYNEPPTTGGSLSAWQRATYDAIRSTGNNNPILLEVSGSRPVNLQQALDPSVYATMTNVIWDAHIYPYQNNGSSDPGSVMANIKGMIAAAQKIRSADGLVPVIIGESGPSTTGSSNDPNGYATIEGLINAASAGKMAGHVPFVWGPGFPTPNSLTDMAGNPTQAYGVPVQLFINTDVVAPTKCQQDQQAQQAIATISKTLTGASQ